jgi:hypothetical protein
VAVIPLAGMLGDLIGNVTMLGVGTSLLAVCAVRAPKSTEGDAGCIGGYSWRLYFAVTLGSYTWRLH